MAALLLPVAAWPATAGEFDANQAIATIRHLSVDIGVRHGGTSEEHQAAHWLATRLQAAGYPTVRQQNFPLPNGRQSQNVWVDKAGDGERVIVVGAHMDSRNDAPGANDNASGCAVVLELARRMANLPTHATLRFVFFGCEEIIDRRLPDGHHFGSRYYVAHLGAAERQRIDGMICVDAVANGSMFVIGDMEDQSPLAASLRRDATDLGYHVLDQTDPGWSDHQAFEEDGVPVAYVRWRVDDHLHTRYDTMQYVHRDKVAAAGRTVLLACKKL